MTTPKAKFASLALIAALCAWFILGLTVPASAGYDEGKAAYQLGDYATALREWRPLGVFGGETLPWVGRQSVVHDWERVHRAGESGDDDEIKTLNEYLQYLSGKEIGEAKRLIDCLSIKLQYIDFAREMVTKEQPLSEFRYYYKDDTLVYTVFAGLGTATQQEMNEVIADVPHSLKMGSQSRGSIPDEYLYFGAMVRLFSHYEVWFEDKTAAFDLTNYPKCKDYME